MSSIINSILLNSSYRNLIPSRFFFKEVFKKRQYYWAPKNQDFKSQQPILVDDQYDHNRFACYVFKSTSPMNWNDQRWILCNSDQPENFSCQSKMKAVSHNTSKPTKSLRQDIKMFECRMFDIKDIVISMCIIIADLPLMIF